MSERGPVGGSEARDAGVGEGEGRRGGSGGGGSSLALIMLISPASLLLIRLFVFGLNKWLLTTFT